MTLFSSWGPSAEAPGGGDGYPSSEITGDFKPPPNRSWLWLLVGILVVGAIGAVGYYLYMEQEAAHELEQLSAEASSLPRDEQGAALRRVLQSSQVTTAFRKDAAQRLGELGDTESINLLIGVIHDTEELSQSAAIALGRLAEANLMGEADRQRARNLIFPQMEASQEMAKTQFAFALALLGDERCVGPLLQGYIDNQQARGIDGLDSHLVSRFASTEKLIELTLNDDPAVRMFGAKAIGDKGAQEGADALIQMLGESNPSVIRIAAESLAKVAPTRAGPELIKLIQKQPDMQEALIVALRDSVGAPGLEPIYNNTEDWDLKLRLIQHVRAPPPPGREVPHDVPRGIGDPRGGDMCDHFYKNYPGKVQVHHEMGLWCLDELGDVRAAEGLFKVAQEEFSPERDSIIDDSLKSVGYLKLPGAKEMLLEMLKQGKGRPATILGALGRVGDETIGKKIEPFTHCPEESANVLSGGACDRDTALKVLGKLHWSGAFKLLSETAARRTEDKVATRVESRDIWQEFRLRDRLGALIGLAHLGDPAAAELLMTTLEDTEDDPQIRLDAARGLAYSANEEIVTTILTKIRNTSLDVETRKFYVAALWHHPTREAINDLLGFIADDSTPSPLLMVAGFAIGEAGQQMVDQQRLRTLLDQENTEHLVPACLAALMAGDEDTIRKLLRVFENSQGVESQVQDRYAGPSGHPVYLTPALFESDRIYQRLRNALVLREAEQGAHGWAWQHLIGRMLNGSVNSPNGMSTFEIRQQLAEDVRNNESDEYKRMAALALLRMGYRGYVLMLAAEASSGSETARQVLIGR